MRTLLLLAVFGLACAQVPHFFDGYQPSFARIRTPPSLLPPMDIHSNVENAKNLSLHGIYEFAQVNEVNIDFLNSSKTIVSTLGTGTLYKMSFEMENALSMAFFFDHFFLPEGAALFIVSEKETAGPFTSENNWDSGKFQTRHVRGSHVELHYFENNRVRVAPFLHLARVTTAFRQAGDVFSNAGDCNVNAICVDPSNTCNKDCKPSDSGCSVQCTFNNQDAKAGQWAGADWNPQIRGTVAVGRAFNSRYCSGSFINNKDGRQLVLTAAHCGPSESDIVLLHFQSPSCSSTDDEEGPTQYSAGSIKTLTRNEDVDNELIEIGEKIPDDWEVFLNGYDASDENSPSHGAVGIHHPSGSNKKISYTELELEKSAWVLGTNKNHWKVNGWTVATTEPGSSGSPLFSHKSKRIVGQLHGGSSRCPAMNGYDMYGAVWAGYTAGGMKEFLGEEKMDGEELISARTRVANKKIVA